MSVSFGAADTVALLLMCRRKRYLLGYLFRPFARLELPRQSSLGLFFNRPRRQEAAGGHGWTISQIVVWHHRAVLRRLDKSSH